MNSRQISFSQQPPEQTRSSPICNTQPFPPPEPTANRVYAYPQPYQSHEYTGSNDPSSYSQSYTETQNQSLTLNQLLQQGNNSGNYQVRSTLGNAQAPFRFDQVPYGQKTSVPNIERPQVGSYAFPNSFGHRYPDPYGRSAYTGYPVGSAYPYFQPPAASVRQNVTAQPPVGEYSACAPPSSPRPSHFNPIPATLSGGRPSPVNNNTMPTISPTPSLSSPVYSTSSGTTWVASAPFGSTSQHQSRPSSASDDHQSQANAHLKSSPNPAPSDSPREENHDGCASDSIAMKSPSFQNKSLKPHTPLVTEQNSEETSTQHSSMDNQLVSIPGDRSTEPGSVSPNTTNNPTRAPSRGSSQQSMRMGSPMPVSAVMPQGSVAQPLPNMTGPSRPPNQPVRPTVIPTMGPGMGRQPYPPYMHMQSPHPATLQHHGHYMVGGRPVSYIPNTYPVRPMYQMTVPGGGMPKVSTPPFPLSSAVPGTMPPPAMPGSTITQVASSTSQQGAHISSCASSSAAYTNLPTTSLCDSTVYSPTVPSASLAQQQHYERAQLPYSSPCPPGVVVDGFQQISSANAQNRVIVAGGKVHAVGLVGKDMKLDQGVRPMVHNTNPAILASNPSFGADNSRGMPMEGVTGGSHPPQPIRTFPGNVYWPDAVPPGSLPQQAPHTAFPPFQHQAQYYRPMMNPHLPGQFPHDNMIHGPMYAANAPHAGNHMQTVPLGISPQSANGFQKLLELGSEPERRPWLEHYVRFMEDLGKPLVGLPQVVKQPLDLYRFYLAVRERGGVLEVIKARRWKEISQVVKVSASASAAYTLRKNYCKFLLDYECRFDRNGEDPKPILAHIESISGKKKKTSPADIDSGMNASGLPPPSPTGSHSSASSSLLPPGSGSASLSGVPTAGSTTSDSQSGSAAQQPQLAGEMNQPPNTGVPDLPDSANELHSSIMQHPSASNSSAPISSNQHPEMNSTAGAVNTVPGSGIEYGAKPSGPPWQWPPCGPSTIGNLVHPSASVNGLPTSLSTIRGPHIPQYMQSSFDARMHYSSPHPVPKTVSHATVSVEPSSSPAGVSAGFSHPAMTVTSTSSICQRTVPSFTKVSDINPRCTHPMQGSHLHQVGVPGHPTAPHTQGVRLSAPMGMHPTGFSAQSSAQVTSSTDPVALLCMHPLRASAPATAYTTGVATANAVPTATANVPAHLIHHHGQRPGYVATIYKRIDHPPFPPGSIEATQIEPTRKRRFRSADIGPISPFKLLMALRSGLTAEVSWAVNCLNIILRDESGVDPIQSQTLPNLITNLVELWRHSLGELFDHDLFITSLELPTDMAVLTDPPTQNSKSTVIEKQQYGDGLFSLERDIVSLAAELTIPISTLRSELRQLLCKPGTVSSCPMRSRNGLLLNLEPAINSFSLLNPNMPTDAGNMARPRRRGKQNIVATSNSSTSAPTSQTGTSAYSVTGKIDSPITWTTARISTGPINLRNPITFANLRTVALYAINKLQQSDDPLSSSVLKRKYPSHSPNNQHVLSSDYLRKLMKCGGGDTTCHIMPPYGAEPFLSGHWSANPNAICPAKSRKVENPSAPPLMTKEECHNVAEESATTRNSSGDDRIQDSSRKLTRYCSASPLTCPILSPQPIDDNSEQNQENIEQSVTVKDSDNILCKDSDSNGSCPLRAREELVHHGLICLWPNFPEVDSNEARAVRCLCVSTVLRNLSFIHAAEHCLSSHASILALIGRVLVLGHQHVGESDTWETVENTSESLEPSRCAWRTPTWLEDMRENALVLLVNISGYLKLIQFEEVIVRPIVEGLLHWLTCPTALAIDPFPGHRTLSPRRLALEAINRLCVHQSNVDMILCTSCSDESDLSKLFDRLAHWLALPEDQVTRELALSTMHYLTGGGLSFHNTADNLSGKMISNEHLSSSVSSHYIGTTMLALAKPCPISGLLAFIEAAETTTRRVIDQFGVHALQERPELMGTSLEMVRRAGALLDRLAADTTGRSKFTPNLELRLLDLVTSRVLDAMVAHSLCAALHRLSHSRVGNSYTVITPKVPATPSGETIRQLLEFAVDQRGKKNTSSEHTFADRPGDSTDTANPVNTNTSHSDAPGSPKQQQSDNSVNGGDDSSLESNAFPIVNGEVNASEQDKNEAITSQWSNLNKQSDTNPESDPTDRPVVSGQAKLTDTNENGLIDGIC